jgi:ATP-binding protein involved in chromosome partitioning
MPPADLASSVLAALGTVIDPEIRRPITELGMVGDIAVSDGGAASVAIKLTIVGCPAATAIERDVTTAVSGVPGVTGTTITVGVMTPTERRALTESLRGSRAERQMPFGPGTLTKVYAITSGKGGVGKSTLTANLAAELASRGLNVGIVDADVHGFSIPGLLGLTDATSRAGAITTPTQVGDMILPPIGYGVKVISIGMFLDPAADGGGKAQAVAWRGPMLHRTINQFLTDVYFGDLDVLLLDLPPGTGDVAISLGQLLPNAEVLVVTTPQPAAADVAERSGIVARQTGQKVIGVIENMAGLAQPDGTVLPLFGEGGGAEVARRLSAAPDADEVPLLASVPLSVPLRAGGDAGAPVVLEHPDDPASVAIRAVADSLESRGRGLVGRRLGLAPV